MSLCETAVAQARERWGTKSAQPRRWPQDGRARSRHGRSGQTGQAQATAERGARPRKPVLQRLLVGSRQGRCRSRGREMSFWRPAACARRTTGWFRRGGLRDRRADSPLQQGERRRLSGPAQARLVGARLSSRGEAPPPFLACRPARTASCAPNAGDATVNGLLHRGKLGGAYLLGRLEGRGRRRIPLARRTAKSGDGPGPGAEKAPGGPVGSGARCSGLRQGGFMRQHEHAGPGDGKESVSNVGRRSSRRRGESRPSVFSGAKPRRPVGHAGGSEGTHRRVRHPQGGKGRAAKIRQSAS